MARPVKLTPELHKKIVALIKSGVYAEIAAKTEGIGVTTFYRYLKIGKRPDAPPEYASFAHDVEEAAAQDEARSVLLLEKIASSEGATRTAECPRCQTKVKVAVPTAVQFQALAWKLERKFPTRYGNTLRIEQHARERLQAMLETIMPRLSEGARREVVTALVAEQFEYDDSSEPAVGEPGVAAPPAITAGGDKPTEH